MRNSELRRLPTHGPQRSACGLQLPRCIFRCSQVFYFNKSTKYFQFINQIVFKSQNLTHSYRHVYGKIGYYTLDVAQLWPFPFYDARVADVIEKIHCAVVTKLGDRNLCERFSGNYFGSIRVVNSDTSKSSGIFKFEPFNLFDLLLNAVPSKPTCKKSGHACEDGGIKSELIFELNCCECGYCGDKRSSRSAGCTRDSRHDARLFQTIFHPAFLPTRSVAARAGGLQ